MEQRNRPDAYDVEPSAEGQAMARKERRRWLTVAEAQALREKWSDLTKAMDEAVEKFDAEPEDEGQATVFIVIAALTVDGFGRSAANAATKLTKLLKDDADGG